MKPHPIATIAVNLPTWPHFPPDERQAVDAVLASGKVNQWTGNEVNAFGDEFAAFHGSKHAVPNANGTVAIELALRALNSTQDVIVPSATFIATASACVAVGAKPVIADVELDTHGLSPETIKAAATKDTQAVIPVHFGGRPVDIKGIKDLCEDRGWKLIEDCAQAHGAEVDEQKVGTFGDVGCFSFCQDKIMTTGGEGGMCITDDEDLFKRMWSYKDHGKDFDAVHQEHPPGFRWLHHSFGTNWRLTEMQAAIGRIQLQKLPDWLEARNRNAGILASYLSDLDGVRIPDVPTNVLHALASLTSTGGKTMKMRYDPDADILMLVLSDEPPMDAVEEPGGVIVSYGRDKRPVSVEFLEASAHHLVTGGRIRLQIEQPDP